MKLKKENKKKLIEKKIIEIGIKISKLGEGAMFVLGDKLKDYKFLVNQDIKKFNLLDNPKTAQSLAMQDGFVWIDNKGYIKGYGMAMTKIEPMLNKGTRHASASYASKLGNKVFVISQEDKKIRIFVKGKIAMQIDCLENGIEKKSGEIVNVLESLGIGVISQTGFLSGTYFLPQLLKLVPTDMGITVFSGVIFFGSSAVFYLVNKFNHNNKK